MVDYKKMLENEVWDWVESNMSVQDIEALINSDDPGVSLMDMVLYDIVDSYRSEEDARRWIMGDPASKEYFRRAIVSRGEDPVKWGNASYSEMDWAIRNDLILSICDVVAEALKQAYM